LLLQVSAPCRAHNKKRAVYFKQPFLEIYYTDLKYQLFDYIT
jgi:hypothetical protein